MTSIRDAARVTVASRAVDGRRHYRARALAAPRSSPVSVMRVHPPVLAAAQRALRPGERIVIVDERTVRLVPA